MKKFIKPEDKTLEQWRECAQYWEEKAINPKNFTKREMFKASPERLVDIEIIRAYLPEVNNRSALEIEVEWVRYSESLDASWLVINDNTVQGFREWAGWTIYQY